MTWFGRDPRVHWLASDDPDLLAQALELIAAADAGSCAHGAPAPYPRA